MTVYEAWAQVMGSVQAIRKTERNQQQGYSFRGIDAVLLAVGPVLREHRVIIVPTAEHMEVERYETAKGGLMQGVIVRMRYTVIGPDGDTFEGSAYGQSADAGDKAVPKAESVAYRTFLLQALTVPTDEPDPDQYSHERAVPHPPPPDPINVAKNRVWEMTKDRGDDEARKKWIAGALEARGLTSQSATADDLNKMADGWAQASAEAAATEEPAQPEAVQP